MTKRLHFRPGMYTVRIRSTEGILNFFERRFAIVHADLLEVRDRGESMLVGDTYTVLYNIDSPTRLPATDVVKFIDVLNAETGTSTGALSTDDIVEIFKKAPFNGRVLDLMVTEHMTKLGYPLNLFRWRSSQPDIGTMVRYTDPNPPFWSYAAVVSRVLTTKLMLHVLDPDQNVRIVEVERSFHRAGTPQSAGRWSWPTPVSWNA